MARHLLAKRKGIWFGVIESRVKLSRFSRLDLLVGKKLVAQNQ